MTSKTPVLDITPSSKLSPGDFPSLENYTEYRKRGTQFMRPYIVGESMEGISVTLGVTPVEGGMIAVAHDDLSDMWYVSKGLFESNYELAE